MRRFLHKNRNTFRLAILTAAAGALSQVPASSEAVDWGQCKATCEEFRTYVQTGQSGDQTENAGDLYDSEAGSANTQLAAAAAKGKCGEAGYVDKNPSPFHSAGMASPGPTTSGTAVQDVNPNTGDERYDACMADLITKWGHVAQHCEVMEMAEKAATAQTAAIIAYGVAAAVCWVACGLIAGNVWTVAAQKAMAIICGIAGIGAAGVDIGYMVDAESTAGNDGGPNGLAYGATIAGAVSAVAATVLNIVAVATLSAQLGMWTSCVAGAMFTTIAILKGVSLALANSTKDDSCAAINEVGGFGSNYVSTSSSSSSGSSVGRTQTTGIDQVQSETQGGANASNITLALTKDFAGVNDNPSMFAQSLAAVAERDGLGGLMKKPGNVVNPTDALAKAGMSFNDFARKVASNPANMAASIAGMPGVTPKVAELIDASDKATRDEMKKMGGEAALMAGAKGGGGGAKSDSKKEDPFAKLFAAKGSAGALGKADEQAFKKEKKDGLQEAESTDIWHEGFGGSIFQIVTQRLGKNRPNVDQVEWQTPLNRALAGLPPLKDGAGAKKPAGGK